MGDKKPSNPQTLKPSNLKKEYPIFEIFIRSKNGLEHRHVGSLHAADAEMAMENARDVYTRRQEGVSIWVIDLRISTLLILRMQESFSSQRRIRCIAILLFMNYRSN